MDANDISKLWIRYEGKGLHGLFEFAKIVAQKSAEEEREACAIIAENFSTADGYEIAHSIRVRSNGTELTGTL